MQPNENCRWRSEHRENPQQIRNFLRLVLQFWRDDVEGGKRGGGIREEGRRGGGGEGQGGFFNIRAVCTERVRVYYENCNPRGSRINAVFMKLFMK